jgi:hypothetical protein
MYVSTQMLFYLAIDSRRLCQRLLVAFVLTDDEGGERSVCGDEEWSGRGHDQMCEDVLYSLLLELISII